MRNEAKIESLSFEDSYTRLDEVINKLEAGDLPLDESVALYEQGIQLADQCERKLVNADLRVSRLLSDGSEAGDSESNPI